MLKDKTRAGRTGRRGRKKQIVALLEERDLAGVVRVVDEDRSAVQVLFSLLYEKDPVLLWRAIEGVGRLAAHVFDSEPATVRDWIRRQIWSMNEESGNMAWYAPETISQIVISVPPLIGEYGRILAANIDEPVFRRGVYFASARIGVRVPETYEDLVDEFEGGLTEDHPTIRGSASLLLGSLGRKDLVEARPALLADEGAIPLYDFATGTMAGTTVGAIARGVLEGADLVGLIKDMDRRRED